MLNVLVLCTGNSARSILAEAIFKRDGADRVNTWSAGSNPTGRVHPGALRLLQQKGMPATGYRSKSWNEFVGEGAPRLDVVITVCSAAAGEVCPIWPGAPLTAHWGVDDPAAAPADEVDIAFQHAYHRLSSRINAFLALPLETMDRTAMADKLREIGESR